MVIPQKTLFEGPELLPSESRPGQKNSVTLSHVDLSPGRVCENVRITPSCAFQTTDTRWPVRSHDGRVLPVIQLHHCCSLGAHAHRQKKRDLILDWHYSYNSSYALGTLDIATSNWFCEIFMLVSQQRWNWRSSTCFGDVRAWLVVLLVTQRCLRHVPSSNQYQIKTHHSHDKRQFFAWYSLQTAGKKTQTCS